MKMWAVVGRKDGAVVRNCIGKTALVAMGCAFGYGQMPRQLTKAAYWEAWVRAGYDKAYEVVEVRVTETGTVFGEVE